ncbi:MAG TPA: TMEM175 family protein, partial [Candidatus Angelobacter sp.]|nr:TMEM175 family protein [Candidatus Angelobacter sp.]
LHSLLLSKGRMEALTDGIFAIAMTLLVLELKAPDLPKSTGAWELLNKIGDEAPAFFSFLVSFLYCGLLWVLHHLAMHFVRHFQVLLVWLNLLFLMSISLMPFSCGLLGHFLHNRAAQEIYFGNMFVAAALLAVQWLVAKKKGLINEDDPIAARLMGQRLMFFPIALPAAMVAAYFNPLAGSWAFAAVLILLRIWQKRAHRAQATTP